MRKLNLRAGLIESYKSMGKKYLKLLEEWEQASNEVEIMVGNKLNRLKTANYK